MNDSQDIFVDEVRCNISMGSYSVGVLCSVIETTISQLWVNRNIEDTKSDTRFFIRALIRGLRDLKN